jgi:GR25 family glycosyltransferase involved in LPS biosynthesis
MNPVILLILVVVTALIFVQLQNRSLQVATPTRVPLSPEFDCYVINMAKNQDRMINFSREYNKSDLASKPFIRYEAVNGSELGDKIHDIVSSKVWLGLNFLGATKRRVGEDQLTPGMIGCYLSHYGVWSDIQSSGKPYGVVFEDDARIYPSIYQNLIRYIVEENPIVPADWDIILLGHWCKNCEAFGSPYFKKPRYFWGLHGYMISQKGCAVMKKYREPEITVQIDHFMSLLSQKDVLKIYAVHPSFVVTSNFGTDLQLGVTPLK